jgi:hypothetical protein
LDEETSISGRRKIWQLAIVVYNKKNDVWFASLRFTAPFFYYISLLSSCVIIITFAFLVLKLK